MSPLTEILAMPLQYRIWVEFMYEILSDTKILESLLVQLYIVQYITVVRVFERAEMGMQFYVIILILL